MKRYSLRDSPYNDSEMIEDEDGEWVKYEDVVQLEVSLNKAHADKQNSFVKALRDM